MDLFDDDIVKPKPAQRKRDKRWNALWEASVSIFYPSGVPRSRRSYVAKLIWDLHEMGVEPDMLVERVKQWPWTFSATCVCTLNGVVGQWDRLVVKPTIMPNVSTKDDYLTESEVKDRKIAEENRARERARKVVMEANAGEVDELFDEWLSLPENEKVGKYLREAGPTGRLSVQWIAARLRR